MPFHNRFPLSASFRPLISNSVKSNLASSIKARNINILEIDENLEALSEVLRKAIVPGFEEYGLTAENIAAQAKAAMAMKK